MVVLQVFDPPMCCPSGVCGPQVNPVLPRFAADLDWIKSQRVRVERFNLAQDPDAFAKNPVVKQMLATDGTECLPLILVDGHVVSQGAYPSRDKLTTFTGIADRKPVGKGQTSSVNRVTVQQNRGGGCCGGSGCCG